MSAQVMDACRSNGATEGRTVEALSSKSLAGGALPVLERWVVLAHIVSTCRNVEEWYGRGEGEESAGPAEVW